MLSKYERDKSEAGWTLIELIIVLAILGLLMTVGGVKVYQKFKESKVPVAKLQISQFNGCLMDFSLDVGRLPTTEEGLQALVQNPGNLDSWKKSYFSKEAIPKDPWGFEYIYRSPGTHGDYDLLSVGEDGKEGTEDDICSWK